MGELDTPLFLLSFLCRYIIRYRRKYMFKISDSNFSLWAFIGDLVIIWYKVQPSVKGKFFIKGKRSLHIGRLSLIWDRV